MTLTQADLNAMTCGGPAHDHSHDHGGAHDGPLVISGQCHPAAPTFTDYNQGVLTFRCARCDLFICSIQVAEGE